MVREHIIASRNAAHPVGMGSPGVRQMAPATVGASVQRNKGQLVDEKAAQGIWDARGSAHEVLDTLMQPILAQLVALYSSHWGLVHASSCQRQYAPGHVPAATKALQGVKVSGVQNPGSDP